jgi:hypothetical protein
MKDKTMLFKNVENRAKYLASIHLFISDLKGWELAMALCEEIERLQEEIDNLKKK